MQLILISFLFSLSFATIFLFFARRHKRSCIVWPLLGACLGLAVLFPFRTYKIAPLDAHFQERLTRDALLQTKEISIPGYPEAYNPSLIPYKEGYLLSFRVKRHDFSTFVRKIYNVRTSYIGVVKLNQQLEICSKPYLLDLVSYDENPSHSAQDARLLQHNDKILLVFNDYGATRHRSSYALYVTELVEQEGKLQPKERATLLKYENMLSIEKNWVPFSAKGKLYLIYSSQPHLILEPDLTTGVCQKIANTQTQSMWHWGEMRGGTPALEIEEGFLTFFHSSQELPAASFFGPKVGRNYAMGAYLFESSPPFALKKITPSPLGTLEDYLKNNRRKVIFPSGIVIEGNLIHIAWGKNDTAIVISTFDREKLLSSMVGCSPEKNEPRP